MAGLYIHVPFCAKRCIYCDFYSQTNTKYKEEYIKAVIRELNLRKNYLNGDPLKTIYFGGGTPSQLQANDFEQIFNAIANLYDISPCEEITLEANPDDISDEYLKKIKQFPFNRISLGVQSFDDKALHFLNRRHNRKQAINAVHLCQEAGFTNLSIDLMYGLPQQSPESWDADLSEALDLKIPHFSAYHLSYEEGTNLYEKMEAGTVSPIDEETSILLFNILIDKLGTAGYLHYEISNFCTPGNFAKHNSIYWTDHKYIGIGPAAHSYNNHSRQWNVSSLTDYITNILNDKTFFEEEILDLKSRYNDYILTHLRTIWGIQLNELHDKFGQNLYDYFSTQSKPYLEKKLLEKNKETVKLSTKGIFISDSIFRDLIK
ncbi:MAG: radical SAM family heme chaperone HemW [Tannerella sp.]|jgi:oxygen-independent coproporphyrinogen-3 oxidase|nr:radical SAM family heme chaperone HemW [Tannerella sp.]